MGLLDWLTGWFDPGIDYAPSDFGFTVDIPTFADTPILDASRFNLYAEAPSNLDIISDAMSERATAIPVTLGATDFSGWPMAPQAAFLDEAGNWAVKGFGDLSGPSFSSFAGGGGAGGGGGGTRQTPPPRPSAPPGGGGGGSNVGLNALLNLPPSDIPDVPRLAAPSLEAPGPLPATPEPVPFSPMTVETTTPVQAPRMLDRLAGSQALFPEARTRALQRMYGV